MAVSIMAGSSDGPGLGASLRPLGHSASDPGLVGRTSSPGGIGSLRSVGLGLATGTTNLYDKMKADGRIRDRNPYMRAAGRSTVVPSSDSAGMDIQPDIFYPAPETPLRERRFRRNQVPGQIHVFHSLRDQQLPAEDFTYGKKARRGVATTELCMKAGQRLGIEAHKQAVAEAGYASNKLEPLGVSFKRGHDIRMLPEGFGNPSGERQDAKEILFPTQLKPDGKEVHELYRRTHSNFDPGERLERNYEWPKEAQNEYFRFGVAAAVGAEGEGARLALSSHLEDDGHYKKTKIAKKVCEDYRNVVHPKFATKLHYKQGSSGPPMHPTHAYGIKSTTSDCTARSCILGYYALADQLPDSDLGRSTKPGRRNVTSETRAFGLPSVRTDVAEASGVRRSMADFTNYGNECSAAALLAPQRFDDKGVPDRDFLLRRPKEELRSLAAAAGESLREASEDFDSIWEEATSLFEDDLQLASLDALLFVHSRRIDARVHRNLAGPALGTGGPLQTPPMPA